MTNLTSQYVFFCFSITLINFATFLNVLVFTKLPKILYLFCFKFAPNLHRFKLKNDQNLKIGRNFVLFHYFITWLAITMVVHCHCSSRIFRCVLVSFAKSLSSFLHTQRKYLTIMKSTTNHQWLKLSQRKNCHLLFCSFDESKSPHNLYWNKNALQ